METLQYMLHDFDFGALAGIHIRCEIEEFGVLSGACLREQIVHHNECAAVVLNHARQEEPVELLTVRFAQRIHLLG
jgi:hypothetical protein